LGRRWDPQQSGIYNYAPRYFFESDFPSPGCTSRAANGAAEWNAVQRELRFLSGSGYSKWIEIQWHHLLFPFNDDFAFVDNDGIGDISNSFMNFNTSPDKPGGGAYTWYCGTGTPGGSQVDMWSVAAHEFGHVVNLEHSAVSSSDTMWPTIAVGSTSKRSLTTHDKAGIKALYGAAQ
jgi:hypothetical protein